MRGPFGGALRALLTTVLVGVAPAFATSACVQDHDLLAERGTGGASPATGGTWTGPGGAGGTGNDSGGAGGMGGKPFVPDGPRTLTVLHGVTDSPWIAFCFARVDSGAELPAKGSPLPSGGLDWGASRVVSPASIDLETDAIRPYVVAAASADAVAGLACTTIVAFSRIPPLRPPPPPVLPEAGPTDASADRDVPPEAAARDAGDAQARSDSSVGGDAALDARSDSAVPATDASVPIPGVRVAALPVIPPGQLARERSYLLVATGCLGGPGITDPSERSICGDTYSRTSPTLGPLLVAVSRTVPDNRVGLAFLDATPTFAHVDVRLSPPGGGDPMLIAEDVVTGALRPSQPLTKWAAVDVGAGGPTAKIQVFPGGSDNAAYQEPWAQSLAPAGLSDLSDGSAYTLVLIGPYPTFAKKRFWNAPLVAVVKN